MTIHASVRLPGYSFDAVSTDKSKDDVRFSFNPGQKPEITEIKALGALWLAKVEEHVRNNPKGAREFAIARTEFQKASMFAILAITKTSD